MNKLIATAGLILLAIHLDAQSTSCPMSASWIKGAPVSNIILNETADAERKIAFKGTFKTDFRIHVFGPDRTEIQTVEVKKNSSGTEIVIPADSKTGEYILAWNCAEHLASVALPVSELPEVSYVNKGFALKQNAEYYLLPADGAKHETAVVIRKSRNGEIKTSEGVVLANAGKEKPDGKGDSTMTFEMPENGCFLRSAARYYEITVPVCIAGGKDKAFVPSAGTVKFISTDREE